MKKLLSLLFLQIFVNLAVTQVNLVINEVDTGTGNVELRSLSPNTVNLGDYALYKLEHRDGMRVFIGGGNLPPSSLEINEVATISLSQVSFTLGVANDFVVALILYRGDGMDEATALNQLQPHLIVDAYIYTTGAVVTNPFANKVTAWTGNVFVADGPTVSRCNDNMYEAGAFSLQTSSMGNPNPCAGGSGDPHFIQQILDKNSKTPQTICYDVVGKSTNQIRILQDFQTKTNIDGILKDDFYMHIMRISISNEIFQFFTDYIQFPNGKAMIWKNTDSPLQYGPLTIKITDKAISLFVKRRSKQLSFAITKEYNDLTGWHLNIGFQSLNATESRFGGMMGDIGKKSFEFRESIQNNGGAMLKDDNHIIQASLKVRSGKKCWFVAFEDIIYPKTSVNYVY